LGQLSSRHKNENYSYWSLPNDPLNVNDSHSYLCARSKAAYSQQVTQSAAEEGPDRGVDERLGREAHEQPADDPILGRRNARARCPVTRLLIHGAGRRVALES